jgi:hypothetical protein
LAELLDLLFWLLAPGDIVLVQFVENLRMNAGRRGRGPFLK